jgi:hypothetical protein
LFLPEDLVGSHAAPLLPFGIFSLVQVRN